MWSFAEWEVVVAGTLSVHAHARRTQGKCRRLPKTAVVASLHHATVSKFDLRTLAEMENIKSHQLFIPNDGEILNF